MTSRNEGYYCPKFVKRKGNLLCLVVVYSLNDAKALSHKVISVGPSKAMQEQLVHVTSFNNAS